MISGPDETTVRWFGAVRPAYLDERTRVPSPTGQRCHGGCDEVIAPQDIGITIPNLMTGERSPYHRDCFLTMIGAGPGALRAHPRDA